MPSKDISQIRQELLQMQQELQKTTPAKRPAVSKPVSAPAPRQKSPLMDFGLYLLSYFFWLIVIVTAEIAVGFGVFKYTVFFAVPCAWLTIAWLRKAPLYALLITVLGLLTLAASIYGASLFFDMSWDSNCYHKPITGMLMNGWNPFQQSMIDFANTHDILPYNDTWLSYQVNNQPKASFMIGAGIYALTGNIEHGKIFNLVSMIACIFIAAPLLRDAFRLRRSAALIIMLLSCITLITISQIALYYNDGFIYQMLTITAVSFVYVIMKPRGALAPAAKLAAFMAACIAVNVKTSAVLYITILSIAFIAVRLGQIAKTADGKERNRAIYRLAAYFIAMAVCAVCVLGASTYITNFLRYGNPLYGMLGANSMNSLLANLMGPKIHALPLIAQFFVSMFSPVSNSLFTEINIKLPFTFSQEEWLLATMDANVSGWGILFGGIFLVSALVVIVTAIRMFSRDTRISWLLFGVLAIVIAPAFVIPYLFSARYYLQPFWVPLTALVCLLAPEMRRKSGKKPKRSIFRVLKTVLAVLLCALLAVNAYTGLHFVKQQYDETVNSRETITEIKEQLALGGTSVHVTTISRGLFYGLFFTLRDAGVDYSFSETMPDVDGGMLYYLVYALNDSGPAQNKEANDFLYSLYRNGYLVVIAANGGGQLTAEMTRSLQNAGLMAAGPADPATGYLAVIAADGLVRYELSGHSLYQNTLDGVQVLAESTDTGVTLSIDGTRYAHAGDGFHIVVYDTKNRLPVYSVVIDPDASPVMTVLPVRVTGGE